MGEAGALALRRRPPLERARAGALRRHRVGARPCQGCRARGGVPSHHAAATRTRATGPTLAKREGEGGLEERRARERGVCAVNRKPDIYLVLSRSGSNKSYKKMLRTGADSSNICRRIKDRTAKINQSVMYTLVEVELLQISCF